MKNLLLPTCTALLCLLASGTAMAHPAPFAHIEMADGTLHLLAHLLMILLAGVGMFFSSYWLIARITKNSPQHQPISR